MSETLTERIKYISGIQPDHLMSAFASDLNEIVTRAEAAEAERDHQIALVDSWIAAYDILKTDRDELRRQLAEAQKAIDALSKSIIIDNMTRRHDARSFLDDALNSGDGVYRP